MVKRGGVNLIRIPFALPADHMCPLAPNYSRCYLIVVLLFPDWHSTSFVSLFRTFLLSCTLHLSAQFVNVFTCSFYSALHNRGIGGLKHPGGVPSGADQLRWLVLLVQTNYAGSSFLLVQTN